MKITRHFERKIHHEHGQVQFDTTITNGEIDTVEIYSATFGDGMGDYSFTYAEFLDLLKALPEFAAALAAELESAENDSQEIDPEIAEQPGAIKPFVPAEWIPLD